MKELSLQENNTNVTVTEYNDIHSLTLPENTAENVLQDKCSVELTISNTTDKNDIDKLSDNTECTESQKCLEDISDEIENVERANINDSSGLTLTEKEIVENILEDTQINVSSVNEKNDSDNKTNSKEISEGSSDTNITEKNIVEPENTEFVQFSQEKHGDIQIENQSIDAEDPFGGDITENIEPMDTDDLNEANIGFSKLCKQADNLQSSFNIDKKDSNEGNKDSSIDILHSSDVILESQDTNKRSNENSDQPKQNENLNTEIGDSTEKSDNQTKKSVDEIAPMDEQSNVLPGQDDELCIIPDSMKVIIPEQTEKSNSNSEESMHEDNKEQNEIKQTCENNEPNNDGNKDSHQDAEESNAVNESTVTHAKGTRAETDSINKVTDITADVINIDEESKNSEIEEITAKEICKQCNEERSCKIKVKIGFDTYNVCSKTCKALFKVANNKATDIPSDGVNSKREKRCANCLLIVEHNDERNLSWETMEFCNEECLGKFQTKYGSYCRNCNGSVQAVSLGKYCVRFGYDVRQFCCSICLEEFKKGLKVCSYCQKDISSSTEGFLAPVGEKGQFKDFCTQDCMEKYSKMSSVEPPNMEKKCCSVCQEVRSHIFFFFICVFNMNLVETF